MGGEPEAIMALRRVKARYANGVLEPREPLVVDDGTEIDMLVDEEICALWLRGARRNSRQRRPASACARSRGRGRASTTPTS